MKRGHISFSPALMPKVLDGSKTMTRRLVKFDPAISVARAERDLLDGLMPAPYASRLWVKERIERMEDRIVYAADGRLVPHPSEVVYAGNGAVRRDGLGLRWPWKPRVLGAMYMPRWASRCSIDLLKLRVQRLQEISEEDAIAEGCAVALSQESWTVWDSHLAGCVGMYRAPESEGGRYQILKHHLPQQILTARESFARLWDSISDKPGTTWAANPWVWCLRFKRVQSLTEGG